MYIIKIPNTTNKLHYVNAVLRKMLDIFTDCALINCTDSPVGDYHYEKYGDMYYRLITINDFSKNIDIANYIDAFYLDHLEKQHISLDEYIDMCLILELNEIRIVKKQDIDLLPNKLYSITPISLLLICPDGFSEIHVHGELSNIIVEQITHLRC